MIDEVLIQILTDEVNFINKEVEQTGNNLADLIRGIDAEVLVYALNLINRLQRENAGLKECGKIVINDLHKTIDKQKTEIEQLKEEHSIMEHNLDFHRNKKFELQKQVDELKFDKELLQKLIDKREKDTAKEIWQELYNETIRHGRPAVYCTLTPNEIKDRAKRYGVEVE